MSWPAASSKWHLSRQAYQCPQAEIDILYVCPSKYSGRRIHVRCSSTRVAMTSHTDSQGHLLESCFLSDGGQNVDERGRRSLARSDDLLKSPEHWTVLCCKRIALCHHGINELHRDSTLFRTDDRAAECITKGLTKYSRKCRKLTQGIQEDETTCSYRNESRKAAGRNRALALLTF